ncbi:hypothetical protein MmTuc01_2863 [Methanosarcina mazei Tuc01]|uniref:Uncharacterized protein n=1 Tax=Methanosarcina mazei Tuc01 TaxID=1236903 RepID=M1Q729_METMZ|nr:hypothetical protein MmTuc01_2863 [Methanosarcina mazei Tuc01]
MKKAQEIPLLHCKGIPCSLWKFLGRSRPDEKEKLKRFRQNGYSGK